SKSIRYLSAAGSAHRLSRSAEWGIGRSGGRWFNSRKVTIVPISPAGRMVSAMGPSPSGPGRDRRQAHQDCFDIAAGLQTKHGAAIVEQVELGIAAAPFELARLLLRRKGHSHPAAHQLWENVEKGFADLAGEGEQLLEIPFQVIIEYPANAAVDPAVRDEE